MGTSVAYGSDLVNHDADLIMGAPGNPNDESPFADAFLSVACWKRAELPCSALWRAHKHSIVSTVNDLDTILAKATRVAREFGASRLLLFGSALENPATARDLDLACAGVPGWKFFELAAALEKALGVPFDLIPLDEPTPFTRLVEKNSRALL